MVDLTGDRAVLSCSLFLHPLTPICPKGTKASFALTFQKHHLEIDIQLMSFPRFSLGLCFKSFKI